MLWRWTAGRLVMVLEGLRLVLFPLPALHLGEEGVGQRLQGNLRMFCILLAPPAWVSSSYAESLGWVGPLVSTWFIRFDNKIIVLCYLNVNCTHKSCGPDVVSWTVSSGSPASIAPVPTSTPQCRYDSSLGIPLYHSCPPTHLKSNLYNYELWQIVVVVVMVTPEH